jgi:hypothetical protein
LSRSPSQLLTSSPSQLFIEPIAEPTVYYKPIAEPTADLIAEPTAKTTAEPISEPIAEPNADSSWIAQPTSIIIIFNSVSALPVCLCAICSQRPFSQSSTQV